MYKDLTLYIPLFTIIENINFMNRDFRPLIELFLANVTKLKNFRYKLSNEISCYSYTCFFVEGFLDNQPYKHKIMQKFNAG